LHKDSRQALCSLSALPPNPLNPSSGASHREGAVDEEEEEEEEEEERGIGLRRPL